MAKTTIEELVVELGADTKKLEAGFKKAERSIDQASKKMVTAGGNLTRNVNVPIVAIGGGLLKMGDSFDKVVNTIRIGTGKSGDELKALEKSFDNVFKVVPDGAQVVAKALTSLNTLTGATGKVLGNLTETIVDVSRLLEEDAVANANLFGKAMKQWEIPAENGVGLMEDLFKVTQDYDISLSALIGQLNTYGVVLQNAGFSVEETAVVMGRMNAAGLDWSRISPALNAAFRKTAKEGGNLRTEFENNVRAIGDATTRTEVLGIATDKFGSEGAQRLLKAIKLNIFNFDDLSESLGENQGLIKETTRLTRTVGDEFGIMANEILIASKPLGVDLLNAFKEIIPQIKQATGYIQDSVTWLKNLSPEAKELSVQAAVAAAALGPLIVGLGLVVGAIGTTVSAIGSMTKLLLKAGPWGLAFAAAGIAVYAVIDALGGWDQAMKDSEKVVSDLAGETEGSFDEMNTATKLLVIGAVIAVNALQSVQSSFVAAGKAAYSAAKGDFSGAWKELEKGGKAVETDFNDVATAIEALFGDAKKTIEKSSKDVKQISSDTATDVTKSWATAYDNQKTNNDILVGDLKSANRQLVSDNKAVINDLDRAWGLYNSNLEINNDATIKEVNDGWQLYVDNFLINEEAKQIKVGTTEATENLRALEDAIEQVGYRIETAWTNISAGVGDSFASMLVDGESFADNMKRVFKDLTRAFISEIVTMTARWAAFQLAVSTGTAVGVGAGAGVGVGAGAVAGVGAGAVAGTGAAGTGAAGGAGAGILAPLAVSGGLLALGGFLVKNSKDNLAEQRANRTPYEIQGKQNYDLKELNDLRLKLIVDAGLTRADVTTFNDAVRNLNIAITDNNKNRPDNLKLEARARLIQDNEISNNSDLGRSVLPVNELLSLEAQREKWLSDLREVQDAFKAAQFGTQAERERAIFEINRTSKASQIGKRAKGVGFDAKNFKIPEKVIQSDAVKDRLRGEDAELIRALAKRIRDAQKAAGTPVEYSTRVGKIDGVWEALNKDGTIKAFADGGIVTAPTLGLIGEAGESEAIIPLSKLPEMMGNTGGDQTIIINLDGRQLSKSVAKNFPSILRLNGMAA